MGAISAGEAKNYRWLNMRCQWLRDIGLMQIWEIFQKDHWQEELWMGNHSTQVEQSLKEESSLGRYGAQHVASLMEANNSTILNTKF